MGWISPDNSMISVRHRKFAEGFLCHAGGDNDMARENKHVKAKLFFLVIIFVL
jgi:hypothetical protein